MKTQIKNYSFSASARAITFSDYEAIDIDSVLYVIHVTDNRAIYNPMNKNLKGSVFGNVLTLNYDTTTMSDDDELQIYYDKIPDPATEGKQDDIIAKLDDLIAAQSDINIDAEQINLNTDGLETLATSTNTKLDTVIAKDFSTSAKQLPNDHDVTVSNMIPAVETGLATEETLQAVADTLQKTVGFDVNSDITTTIVTVGAVKTITETDGVKTNTTTVDKTDADNILITNIWS